MTLGVVDRVPLGVVAGVVFGVVDLADGDSIESGQHLGETKALGVTLAQVQHGHTSLGWNDEDEEQAQQGDGWQPWSGCCSAVYQR